MVQQIMGPLGELNPHQKRVRLDRGDLNPHQLRARRERAGEIPILLFCTKCRRYEQARLEGNVFRYLECGSTIEKERIVWLSQGRRDQ